MLRNVSGQERSRYQTEGAYAAGDGGKARKRKRLAVIRWLEPGCQG
jgi:hypothetical protein